MKLKANIDLEKLKAYDIENTSVAIIPEIIINENRVSTYYILNMLPTGFYMYEYMGDSLDVCNDDMVVIDKHSYPELYTIFLDWYKKVPLIQQFYLIV